MNKRGFYQQYSIDDAIDAVNNYEDSHYEEFQYLLFNELLVNIQGIPFDRIIETHLLTQDNLVYETLSAHSLFWLYGADRKMINSKTIYSFRFANACHPDLYQSFEIKAHRLFKQVPERRHRFIGWYEHIGQDLLDDLDRYLNIKRVVKNSHSHVTKLFINQEKERLDIRFDFPSLNERIVITFEPGYPVKLS
jgi:hypothetical protein